MFADVTEEKRVEKGGGGGGGGAFGPVPILNRVKQLSMDLLICMRKYQFRNIRKN